MTHNPTRACAPQNVVELLDDLFQRAAAAREPHSRNFIAKHAADMSARGLANPAARLFSNPAGGWATCLRRAPWPVGC